MRKRNVEKYIKWCEKELSKLEQESIKLQKENEKNMVYDLTDHYLNEENFRGKIDAAKYILNNC